MGSVMYNPMRDTSANTGDAFRGRHCRTGPARRGSASSLMQGLRCERLVAGAFVAEMENGNDTIVQVPGTGGLCNLVKRSCPGTKRGHQRAARHRPGSE